MFLAATLVLWAALLAAGGHTANLFQGQLWVKWDAGHYQAIASSGYFLSKCLQCSDAGWFPGYPLFFEIVHLVGVGPYESAVLVAWGFDWALLVLLWVGFLRDARPEIRYSGLALAAFAAGGIYMRAAFPLSTTNFFLIATLLAARKSRWGLAGVLGAFAGLSYPDASFVLPPLAVLALFELRHVPLLARLRRVTVFVVLFLTGPVAVLVWQYIEIGKANAFFTVQASYDSGTHNPLSIWWTLVSQLFHGSTGIEAATGAEAGLATLLMAVVTAAVVVALLRRVLTAWEFAVWAYLILAWVYPLTLAHESWWRADAMLLPSVLLFPRVDRAAAALTAAAGVAVFPLLAIFFFQGTLI
jgi:hypothetical protein